MATNPEETEEAVVPPQDGSKPSKSSIVDAMKRAKSQEHQSNGQIFVLRHRYEEALLAFSRAIFLEPSNAGAYVKRADVFTHLCDFKSAISNLKKAVSLHPNHMVYRRKLAVLMDTQGVLILDMVGDAAVLSPDAQDSLNEAVSYFSQAIKEDALNPHFWLHRALGFVKARDWTKALADTSRYVTLDSHNADVYLLRAKLYWKLNMRKKGFHDLESAMRINAEHPEVKWFSSVLALEAQVVHKTATRSLLSQNLEEGLRQLTHAYALNKNDVNTLVLRASAYRQLSRFAEALKDLAQAETILDGLEPAVKDEQKKDRGSGVSTRMAELKEVRRQRNLTLNDMALAAMKREQYCEALELFNTVIKSEVDMALNTTGPSTVSENEEPQDSGAGMFDAMEHALHWRCAKSRQAAAVVKPPTAQIDPRFYRNRGDCHRMLTHWPQALNDYHRAHVVVPKDTAIRTRLSLVHNAMGLALFNERVYAGASLEFTSAIAYDGQVAQFHAHRGCAEYTLQNYEGAFQDFERALEIDPDNNLAQQKLHQYRQSHMDVGRSSARSADPKSRLLPPLGTALPMPSAAGAALPPWTRQHYISTRLQASKYVKPPAATSNGPRRRAARGRNNGRNTVTPSLSMRTLKCTLQPASLRQTRPSNQRRR